MVTSSDGDAEDRLLAITCGGCGIAHDRCCITLQLITLDEVTSGAVVKCPLCHSVAVSAHAASNVSALVPQASQAAAGSKRARLSHDTMTIEGEEFADDGGSEALAWTWWGGRGPYCPFCVVPMAIIT